jgi:3-hydroxyacyl-CoA dehydrogenase/enoyl-CoA hydratase/3-hydroxybutyryl-CoA epimerase
MLAEGVAPARIEAGAIAGGLPIGPLAMLDETGIVLNWQQARQARADGLGERASRALAWPVLDRMVSLGRRGRREGAGFYDYPASGAKELWKGLADVYPPRAEQPELDAAQRRLMHAQAMEAARCLEDGTVASVADADTGSVLGLGFPASEGGVLGQIERRGLGVFVTECDALSDAHGERFRPSHWLRERAAAGAFRC